jgi:hypothetical protein
MNYYQTDTDGFFAGSGIAQESPRETDVFLIPKGAVTVAPPALSLGERARWTGSAWEVVPPEAVGGAPEATLAQTRATAERAVDAVVRATRLLFVTAIPAQETTYVEKEQEAIAFLAQSPTPVDLAPYRKIGFDSFLNDVSAVSVAQEYVTMAQQWRFFGDPLEAARTTAKANVRAAADIAAVETIVAAFEAVVTDILAAEDNADIMTALTTFKAALP